MSKLSEYGLRVTIHGDDDVITAILRNKDGEQVGEIEALFNDAISAYQVKSAYTVDSVPKGKGIGQEFYSFLNSHVKRKGFKLASDFKKMQSEPARELWKKFKSTGKASGPYQYKPRPTPEMTYDMMEVNEMKLRALHLNEWRRRANIRWRS